MKLKKLLCIAFAVIFVVVASAIAINAAYVDNIVEPHASCCSNYSYTVSEVYAHQRSGYDCMAKTRTYCNACHTIYDDWEGGYIPCIHPGLGNFGY